MHATQLNPSEPIRTHIVTKSWTNKQTDEHNFLDLPDSPPLQAKQPHPRCRNLLLSFFYYLEPSIVQRYWTITMGHGAGVPPEPIVSLWDSKSTRIHQNPSESIRIHQNPPESTRIHQNPPESTRIHQNPPESTRIHQNPSESISILYHQRVTKSWTDEQTDTIFLICRTSAATSKTTPPPV